MKAIKTIVLSTLAATLLLIAVSCGKGKAEENPMQSAIYESPLSASAATITVESETTWPPETHNSELMEAARHAAEEASRHAAEEASRAESIKVAADLAFARASEALGVITHTKNTTTGNAVKVSQLQKPPTLQLQYKFVLRETVIPSEKEIELMHVAYIYPCTYTWIVEDANGTRTPFEEDNGRPCDYEKTSHLKLSEIADSDYVVDFRLNERQIESFSLIAYPLDNLENGVPCTVQDGKLTLFQTPHYYELTVQYTQGTAVYGFFAE